MTNVLVLFKKLSVVIVVLIVFVVSVVIVVVLIVFIIFVVFVVFVVVVVLIVVIVVIVVVFVEFHCQFTSSERMKTLIENSFSQMWQTIHRKQKGKSYDTHTKRHFIYNGNRRICVF